jgi:hypothetical protein
MVPALAILLGGVLQVALIDPKHWDLGWAYKGGVEAWRSGHPEHVRSWMSTSVLGTTMALVSHFMSEEAADRALTGLNVGLVVLTLGVVWRRLRGSVPRAWWWASLALAAFFAPLISSLLYKQFNVIALCLALAGFAAVRGGRSVLGSALIGLSVCLKPLVLLLPLALLARRDTRRSGLWSLASILVFTALAQGFLAFRAHDVTALNPLPALQNFSVKGQKWIFSQENFSPRGMLCRLSTTMKEYPFTRGFGILALVLLILAANRAIGRYPGTSWEVFSFACLLSPMVGPIAWGHYQLLLAPMLLLLAYQFTREGASWVRWGFVLGSYALADLLLRPLGDSVPGGLWYLVTGQRETIVDIFQVMAVSQFAQYVLYGTALSWFRRSRPFAGAVGG